MGIFHLGKIDNLSRRLRLARAKAKSSLVSLVNPRDGERTDNRRACGHPLRTDELVECVLKSGIRSADAIGVLNDRFAVGEKTSHSKGHRDGMIAQAVVYLDNLCAHDAQIVRDGGDAIGFFNAQFLGVANNGGATGERAGDSENGQLVDELRDFFPLDDGALERRASYLNDAAMLELIDILNRFAHLSAHSN